MACPGAELERARLLGGLAIAMPVMGQYGGAGLVRQSVRSVAIAIRSADGAAGPRIRTARTDGMTTTPRQTATFNIPAASSVSEVPGSRRDRSDEGITDGIQRDRAEPVEGAIREMACSGTFRWSAVVHNVSPTAKPPPLAKLTTRSSGSGIGTASGKHQAGRDHEQLRSYQGPFNPQPQGEHAAGHGPG